MAPAAVATSSNIASRVLVYPSRTYAAADPVLVAMTATSEAPMA